MSLSDYSSGHSFNKFWIVWFEAVSGNHFGEGFQLNIRVKIATVGSVTQGSLMPARFKPRRFRQSQEESTERNRVLQQDHARTGSSGGRSTNSRVWGDPNNNKDIFSYY